MSKITVKTTQDPGYKLSVSNAVLISIPAIERHVVINEMIRKMAENAERGRFDELDSYRMMAVLGSGQ